MERIFEVDDRYSGGVGQILIELDVSITYF